MLRVQLQALHEGSVETAADVPADDPLFSELEFTLAAPVGVRGRLMDSGSGRYYWHGTIQTELGATCRRCLSSVPIRVDQDVRVVFTDESNADDPSAYAIDARAADLDLGPMVREELILAVPDYVLCRDDCRGLCARCGKNLNEGACECTREPDPRWAALDALREAGPHQEK
jgi:uncharacterized protein